MNLRDSLPPLVSPRSPSYARARRELEEPSPTGDPIVVGLLNRLVEIEHDARRACQTAANAVADDELAEQLRSAADAHEERREAIGELVEHLGGSPPAPHECRPVLSHGVNHMERAETNEEIGNALRAMYTEIADAYREAMGASGIGPDACDVLRELAPRPPAH